MKRYFLLITFALTFCLAPSSFMCMSRAEKLKEVDCDIIREYCKDKHFPVLKSMGAEFCYHDTLPWALIVEKCIAKKEMHACRFISEFLKAQEQKDLRAAQEEHQDLRAAIDHIIEITPQDF